MTTDIQTQDISARQELRRIEAFSDGVFAIACTLLVLEFKVPHVDGGSGSLWPRAESGLAVACGLRLRLLVDPAWHGPGIIAL